jgi:hypothetical protein
MGFARLEKARLTKHQRREELRAEVGDGMRE